MTKVITPRRLPPARISQQGLALVETAIALPILILLMIPVGELVRAFFQYSLMAHHTRSALRYVAEHAVIDTTGLPVISADLTLAAKNIVVYGSKVSTSTPVFPGLSVLEVSAPIVTADGNILLTVTHPYQSLLPFGGRIPGLKSGADIMINNLPLTVSYTMRPL